MKLNHGEKVNASRRYELEANIIISMSKGFITPYFWFTNQCGVFSPFTEAYL